MIKKLSDICSFISGNAWKASEFADEGIPIIRINNMNTNDNDFVYWQGDYDKKYLINKGDLLVSLSGTIKTFQWNSREALLNQRIVKVVANPETNQDWVYYQIFHVIEQIANKGKHAVIKNVSVNELKNFEVNVPDFQTQNKIVAILDKANALVQKRQQVIDLLDELLRSQFLEMFGNPVVNPKGWETIQFSNLGDFKNGLNYSQSDSGFNVFCLGVGDFKSKSRITPADSLSSISLSSLPSEDYFLKKGDLVFVRSNGNKELVGRCVEVFPEDKRISYSGFCIRFRLSSERVLSTYLNHVLRNPAFKRKMLEGGRGANISNINQKNLGKLEIPIPDIELQEKYVDFTIKIESSLKQLEVSQSQIQNLFNSILQRSFIGKLDLDISVELDALLEEIDLQKSENDLYSILSNEEYVNSLVERLNTQDFENQELYDKAKHAAFQLLKTDEILAQQYDEASKSLKLVVK
jgi:type I restriction enzyme S subunit